ncbi:TfuA-like protein [Rhizobium lemnae]|uniref:TfuA-like protein n=1 Tax=Rhizobium lemnae TaxID=1214924 RepID=A0ABV8EC71_9HYPH|nr:TfuA-like protein [Rhizobium lemnae]MCJ8510061.1 TfuA-like protein [Rhizobium lemnae]
MKIVFVGPTLPDASKQTGTETGIVVAPPARQGDIMDAVAAGATEIGIVDGYFEYVAPVWHKEILFALHRGCRVYGAASMGALRACECHPYGMEGIGQIYEDYRNGRRVDDGDVALLHGPAELNYHPLTIPLVNIDATLGRALERSFIDERERDALASASRALFFKERTWKRIAQESAFPTDRIREMLADCSVDQKREDALMLMREVRHCGDSPRSPPLWPFHTTPTWRRLYGDI